MYHIFLLLQSLFTIKHILLNQLLLDNFHENVRYSLQSNRKWTDKTV